MITVVGILLWYHNFVKRLAQVMDVSTLEVKYYHYYYYYC